MSNLFASQVPSEICSYAMDIHVLNINNLSAANRTPRIAKPALRDKQTDKQVEMGDSGLLEL